MSFLLDTDTCSAYLKGEARLWQRFMQYGGRLYASTITVAELYAWVLRSKSPPRRRQALEDLLRDVRIIDVDSEVARRYGEVRASQLDRGELTPPLDLLNAAVALVHDLIVVTHDTQDFVNVPDLRIDDWLAP